MIKLGIYAICLSLLAPTSAFADYFAFDRGNALYENCISSESVRVAFCLGSASAYLDMMQALGYFCPGYGRTVNRRQVFDVFTKFLKENPELRHQPAASLAVQAFTKGFGCKQQ
jgi:hypothetical protein